MVTIREAAIEDAAIIHGLVYKLAKYENEPEGVVTTVKDYKRYLSSDKPPFNCFIAEIDGKPVGIALWYPVFSTWTGPNMFLEDLFVSPEHRGEGIGRALLKKIVQTAVENNYARVRWDVIDFNESAKKVYRKMGAKHVANWEHWRLEGVEISKALDSL